MDYLRTGGAYQVEVIRRDGRYYVHVTIEETVPDTYVPRGGAVGADTNPDGLGVARADYLGQLRENRWIPQPE